MHPSRPGPAGRSYHPMMLWPQHCPGPLPVSDTPHNISGEPWGRWIHGLPTYTKAIGLARRLVPKTCPQPRPPRLAGRSRQQPRKADCRPVRPPQGGKSPGRASGLFMTLDWVSCLPAPGRRWTQGWKGRSLTYLNPQRSVMRGQQV